MTVTYKDDKVIPLLLSTFISSKDKILKDSGNSLLHAFGRRGLYFVSRYINLKNEILSLDSSFEIYSINVNISTITNSSIDFILTSPEECFLMLLQAIRRLFTAFLISIFINKILIIIIQFAYVFHYILLTSPRFAYLQKLLLKHFPDPALIR